MARSKQPLRNCASHFPSLESSISCLMLVRLLQLPTCCGRRSKTATTTLFSGQLKQPNRHKLSSHIHCYAMYAALSWFVNHFLKLAVGIGHLDDEIEVPLRAL